MVIITTRSLALYVMSFLWNIIMYLHLMSFIHTETSQVVGKSSSWKAKTLLSYIVNTMAADGLATQGARTSVAMVFTQF